MTERLVDTGRVRLNVLDEGAGPPVVLMHGWSYDLHLWDALAPEVVRAGFRAIRFDLRGHGASPVTPPYPFDELVRDLNDVMGVFEVERPALVGLSLGGFVGMRYAIDRPAAVSALVLADTCPHAIPQDGEMAATIPASSEGAEALGAWWDERHPAPAGHSAGEAAGDPAGGAGGAAGDPARAARRERFLRNSADGVRHAIAACAGREDVTARLPEIAAPTLVIGGEYDAMFPPALHADMAARIPGARHRVIADAGHIACRDQPEAFNDVVVAFLRAAVGP